MFSPADGPMWGRALGRGDFPPGASSWPPPLAFCSLPAQLSMAWEIQAHCLLHPPCLVFIYKFGCYPQCHHASECELLLAQVFLPQV